MKIEQVGGKIYATSRAYILDADAPRELASALPAKTNPSFLYIAGRYVQANNPNRNGHFWTFDDLEYGESSIKNTPVNINHDWTSPIGVIIDTKLVERASADDSSLPEVHAISAIWQANFPQEAEILRMAHAAKSLHYSMECVAERTQCLACDDEFPYATASADMCEHLSASPTAPRRFVNPVFLGGGLIVPPKRPGWADADITELAHEYAIQCASHVKDEDTLQWESLMSLVMDASE